MKKIITSLLFLVIAINAYSASFPNEIFIREHWISLTKSYDIKTKTHKLGTIYRRFFSLLLTYDFYDPSNTNTLSAKARFFSYGAHLDLYEPNGTIVGSVKEKIFTFFPAFDIYAPNLSTKLARAEMNFWGTKFYIYDPATNKEMAIMSRPYFRFKNDWTIKVTHPTRLEQKQIDPRVLMTVLAIQGEIEDWQDDHYDDNYYLKAKKTNQKLMPLAQIKTTSTTQASEEELEALVNELDQDFNTTNPSTEGQSNEERIEAFKAYCENLINTPGLPAEKKNAIISLLQFRLGIHNKG